MARRRIIQGYAALLLALALASREASASEGDRDPHFRSCVHHCQHTGCAPIVTFTHSCHPALACSPDHSVPWALRLSRWTCLDDCKYQCMVEQERVRRLRGMPPRKYDGRWPFQRVLGMHELVSVLFSLLNLAAHAVCLTLFQRTLAQHRRQAAASMEQHPQPDYEQQGLEQPQQASQEEVPARGGLASQQRQRRWEHAQRRWEHAQRRWEHAQRRRTATTALYPYGWLWTLYGCCHMVAWVCSAMFHAHDTKVTERLDYCAAIAVVYVGLAAALVRTLALRAVRTAAYAALLVAVGLALHLHHMLYVKFDYGWNVKVCVVVGVAAALLWLVWALRAHGHPGRWTLLAFLLAAHLALLLELLDFPPKLLLLWPEQYMLQAEGTLGLQWHELILGLGLVDAHACWHAATVPLTLLFYSFLSQDVQASHSSAMDTASSSGSATTLDRATLKPSTALQHKSALHHGTEPSWAGMPDLAHASRDAPPQTGKPHKAD